MLATAGAARAIDERRNRFLYWLRAVDQQRDRRAVHRHVLALEPVGSDRGAIRAVGTVVDRRAAVLPARNPAGDRSEEHTSELQSLMRISYAVFCLKKNKKTHTI